MLFPTGTATVSALPLSILLYQASLGIPGAMPVLSHISSPEGRSINTILHLSRMRRAGPISSVFQLCIGIQCIRTCRGCLR